MYSSQLGYLDKLSNHILRATVCETKRIEIPKVKSGSSRGGELATKVRNINFFRVEMRKLTKRDEHNADPPKAETDACELFG